MMRAGIRRRLAMRSLISGRNARLPALLLEQGDSCVIEAHKDFAPQPLAIMGDDSIRVTATTVRIPVMGGHSESVNVEFANDFDLNEVKALLSSAPGIVLVDDPAAQQYPMPMDAHEKDEVFVGRLRRDETQPNTLNMWIVSDNLRKGAATNAVQIAEYLQGKGLL